MSEDTRTERELFEEAAGWFLRRNATPDDPALRRQFDGWLAAPRNRAAWEEVSRTWDMLGAAAPAPAQAIRGPAPARRRIRRWRRPALALSGGLAALWMIWLALPAARLSLAADYRTAAAQSELVRMADGSSVDLGGASAISAEIGPAERRVRLLAGEAFFDIAPDRDRPFIVDAAGVQVTVHGTAFDVLVTSESTTVALLRGAVEAQPVSGGDPLLLSPGQQIVIDHRSRTSRIEEVAAEDIGAWRDGMIFLDDVTLGEAAEIIERYHSAWIAIPDRRLAALRVNGLIDLRDPDAALALLAAPFGARVRAVMPLTRVITRF